MVPDAALAAHRARVDRNPSGTKSHKGNCSVVLCGRLWFNLLQRRARFPQLSVTSDLAPVLQTADYRQGGGSRVRSLEKRRKPFVFKILTSKP